ncbi:hypothetical protein ACQKMD_10945 [Viridibacillus sp. NPDC096237]|uniref:hypothetical protein n=1 Tax=Viridibacillus sp. NPDC096237 TaxID=3390721 RepID=UPI003D052799
MVTNIPTKEKQEIKNEISYKIQRLVINEVKPVDNAIPEVNYSPVFNGEHLKNEIHLFFENHINNIIMNKKTRNGRFKNDVSTILNSIEHLLSLKNNPIPNDSEEIPETLSEDEKLFYYHSKKVTDQLAKSINKNVKKPFLLVILHFNHEVYGEIIAIIKMERIFGVQFSRQELHVQIDMLPDKERDLQKCTIIFKNKLINLPVNSNFRENNNQNDHHTKILDRQDLAISQYFMTSFLDNIIITLDKENTQLATQFITSELEKYVSEGCTKKNIKDYIDNKMQERTHTSIETIVEDLINNTNFVNRDTIQIANQDSESLSALIYSQMLNANPSAQQTFTADPNYIEKKVIKDIKSSGKELKISIAQTIINKGVVKYDYKDDEELNSEEWMKIAISKAIIDDDDNDDDEE